MNKLFFSIGMLLILATSTLINAKSEQITTTAIPIDESMVFIYFSPTSATSGTSVTLNWFSDGNVLGCYILGVPGISFVQPSGSYTFTASQSLNASISCDVIGDFNEDTHSIFDSATFTLVQPLTLDFDLIARNSTHTGPRYARIEVVNPVDVRYCEGDGIQWITTSGNYQVTCYDVNGASKTKSIYINV